MLSGIFVTIMDNSIASRFRELEARYTRATPAIMIRHTPNDASRPAIGETIPNAHTAATSNGDQHYVLALFSQVQGLEVMGTGLCVAELQDKISLSEGEVIQSHSPEKAAEFIENLSGTPGSELVGFTVENSNIGILRFEVSAASPLAEGQVVFVRLNGTDVFYQILDAQTAEESFDQNPRGTHIVNAVQLGC